MYKFYFVALMMAVPTLTTAQDSNVEVDPAPSGVEMHDMHVFHDGSSIGLPGADSGVVSYGGVDSGGNSVTIFDFSNGGGGGGSSLDDTNIFYEMR